MAWVLRWQVGRGGGGGAIKNVLLLPLLLLLLLLLEELAAAGGGNDDRAAAAAASGDGIGGGVFKDFAPPFTAAGVFGIAAASVSFALPFFLFLFPFFLV